MGKITQKELKLLINYNEYTGIFTWKVHRNNKTKIGDIAGCSDKYGYVVITINNKQ